MSMDWKNHPTLTGIGTVEREHGLWNLVTTAGGFALIAPTNAPVSTRPRFKEIHQAPNNTYEIRSTNFAVAVREAETIIMDVEGAFTETKRYAERFGPDGGPWVNPTQDEWREWCSLMANDDGRAR